VDFHARGGEFQRVIVLLYGLAHISMFQVEITE